MNVQLCILWAGSDKTTHAMQIVGLLEHYRPSVKVGLPKENWIRRKRDEYIKTQEHFYETGTLQRVRLRWPLVHFSNKFTNEHKTADSVWSGWHWLVVKAIVLSLASSLPETVSCPPCQPGAAPGTHWHSSGWKHPYFKHFPLWKEQARYYS